MRVQFLKDVTVEVLFHPVWKEEKLYLEKTEIEVDEVISTSIRFADLVLPSGNVLIDVRKDVFKEVVCQDQGKK